MSIWSMSPAQLAAWADRNKPEPFTLIEQAKPRMERGFIVGFEGDDKTKSEAEADLVDESARD
jgi:hypothetical protein